MPTRTRPPIKPSYVTQKSPHPAWQAQQQKLRHPPRRMLKRLAGKR